MASKLQRYIKRAKEKDLKDSFGSFPVTALLGPRQCGKSTLAKKVLQDRKKVLFLDLERPSDLKKLDDAEFYLEAHTSKLICIDEIQRKPELFPLIRVMVDENPGVRFLILGSASVDLLRQSSESLAGRIHFIELAPFHYMELNSHNSQKYSSVTQQWIKGGFPNSILAKSNALSMMWREDFIRTFLERDIPQFGFSMPSNTLHRFWSMLAHYHGQLLNSSSLGQSLGVSYHTIRKYLEVLSETFMVRVLLPLHGNLKKRLVKSPKTYIRDTGILHSLLGIEDRDTLFSHPVMGYSWESWCIEQICALLPKWTASFYRTSSGEEIDLILERGGKKLAFECKASMSPRLSKGFPATIKLLAPEKAWVIAPVKESYSIQEGIVVCPPTQVFKELQAYA